MSSTQPADRCPVDHSSVKPSSSADAASADACPVDHSTRSTWARFLSSKPGRPVVPLSEEREISSIPKAADGNWVYPSETQFFNAMARKNHDPQPADMKSIVPIHNAVNERAWAEILKWETGRGGEACGGVKLVNFKGKPTQKSPKAQFNMLLGYAGPFDRHDWVVDRCGTKMRYIIDFYTGHSASSKGDNLSFYLDVRPALDSWEGVKMRIQHLWS